MGLHATVSVPRATAALLVTLWLGISCALATGQVRDSDEGIEIPAPSGYSRVTPGMRALNDALDVGLPSTNKRLAAFIPERDVATALQGGRMELVHYFQVQAMKSADGQGRAFFESFKAHSRNGLNTADVRLQQDLRDIEQRASAWSGGQGSPQDVQIKDPVTFAPHYEADNELHFSVLIPVVRTGPSGTSERRVAAGTSVFLFVADRMIFVYVFGGERDLEWTRSQARTWVQEILAANASATVGSSNDAGQVPPRSSEPGGLVDNAIRKSASGAIGGFVVMVVLGLGTAITSWVVTRLKRTR